MKNIQFKPGCPVFFCEQFVNKKPACNQQLDRELIQRGKSRSSTRPKKTSWRKTANCRSHNETSWLSRNHPAKFTLQSPFAPYYHTPKIRHCLLWRHTWITHAGHPSPRCRPLNLFLVRLHAGMKTGFILITHWNIELYDILEARNETRWRETGSAGVKPCFIDCHCLFVRHTTL